MTVAVSVMLRGSGSVLLSKSICLVLSGAGYYVSYTTLVRSAAKFLPIKGRETPCRAHQRHGEYNTWPIKEIAEDGRAPSVSIINEQK
jgi:hypothetical protein